MVGHWTSNPFKWDFPASVNNPHVSRYLIARGFIFPWETVLDAACAEGYGSKVIAMQAKHVTGYEIDEGCIQRANNNKPVNTTFEVKDLDTCDLPEVDVAVSFETIEHLNDMRHFIKQLKTRVKRAIIMSVPLGGTSYAYKDEPPSPGTEKNDFMTHDAVNMLFNDDEWHVMTYFKFGYSHLGVYFRDQLEVPDEIRQKGFVHNG